MSINASVKLSLSSLLYLAFTHICSSAFSSLANIPQKIREMGASLYNRMFSPQPTQLQLRVAPGSLQLASDVMSISSNAAAKEQVIFNVNEDEEENDVDYSIQPRQVKLNLPRGSFEFRNAQRMESFTEFDELRIELPLLNN